MTGPGFALIIIPIVATAGLGVWLTMVFSADGHSGQADRNPIGRNTNVPGKTAERLATMTTTASRPIEAVARGAPASRSSSRHDARLGRPLAR